MASNWIGRAKTGEAPFAQPIDLAMVASMNAGPLFFIVRARAPIRIVSDLRGASRCGRPAHERHGAARARYFRRAGHELFRLHAGLSRFCRRRRGAGGRRGRRPIPMSHSQCGHDRASPRGSGCACCPTGRDELERRAARLSPTIVRTVDARRRRPRARRRPAPGRGGQRAGHHRRVPDVQRCAAVAAVVVAAADELGGSIRCLLGMSDLFAPLRSRKARAALEFGGVALHPGALRLIARRDC